MSFFFIGISLFLDVRVLAYKCIHFEQVPVPIIYSILKVIVKVLVYVRFAAIQKHQAREQIFHGPEFIFLHFVLGNWNPGIVSEWFAKACIHWAMEMFYNTHDIFYLPLFALPSCNYRFQSDYPTHFTTSFTPAVSFDQKVGVLPQIRRVLQRRGRAGVLTHFPITQSPTTAGEQSFGMQKGWRLKVRSSFFFMCARVSLDMPNHNK